MKKLLESLEAAARTQSAADVKQITDRLDGLQAIVSERLRTETVPTPESLEAGWAAGLWADAYRQLLIALAREREHSARSRENLALLVGEVREYTATTQAGMKRQWQPDKGTILLFLFLLALVLFCVVAILGLKHRILALHKAAQQTAHIDRAMLIEEFRAALRWELMRMPPTRFRREGDAFTVEAGLRVRD